MNSDELVNSIGRFRDFIDQSQAVIAALDSSETSTHFRTFVREATPLLIEPIREALDTLLVRMDVLWPWIVRHDLLAVAGLDSAEDSYTELIAWALDPRTHPPSADKRQRAWLESLSVDHLSFRLPAEPITQFVTADGIPDLVLRYDGFVVVVEAKTGSAEHDTPAGLAQTLAYPDAVVNALHLPADTPVHVVFLTPDRRTAANQDALRTSYVDFVVALAGALGSVDLPSDLRFAFSMLFTHLLLHATPRGFNSQPYLLERPPWLVPDDEPTRILSHLREIHDALTVFLRWELP